MKSRRGIVATIEAVGAGGGDRVRAVEF